MWRPSSARACLNFSHELSIQGSFFFFFFFSELSFFIHRPLNSAAAAAAAATAAAAAAAVQAHGFVHRKLYPNGASQPNIAKPKTRQQLCPSL